jgi:putative ABC transport system ATP-binding protein
MSRPPAVHLKGVRFAYRTGPLVLDIQELLVPAGETVFLHGPSGSGKTTLLGLIAGVLGASQGEVRVLGTDLGAISGGQRDAFRGSRMGYIFQMFNLIPYLTALENITLPCRMSGARRARVDGNLDDAARALADRLEITGHLRQRPGELSVGQQQRVAACRALLGSPELVVADEPTSALDHDRRTRFLELLFDSCESVGATLLFVSHDRTLEGMFDRALSLPEVNRVGLSAA